MVTLASMDQTELARTYGNPAAKTFRKQHIRLVTAGGTSALVNTEILNITAGLLQAAAEAGGTFPARIDAWEPLLENADYPRPQHYGLALNITTDPDLAARYGFVQDGPRWLIFTGNLEDKHAAAIEAETQQVLLLVGPEMDPNRPRAGTWSTDRPGQREPGPGDKGDDVQFFQLLYGCPHQDGIMTDFDTALIEELQRRWGLTITGTITAETWIMLLPNPRLRSYNIEYGDINHTVKILQALLIAYDWTDGNLPITSRFDQATARALATVQETYGLRNQPAAGSPEWAALLGRWPIGSPSVQP